MRKLTEQASSNGHSSARVRLQIPTGFKAINCRLSAEPAGGKKLTTTVAAQHRDTGDNSIDWLITIDALLFMAQMETASNVELHFSPSHPMVMSETDLRDLSSIHRGEGIKACIFRVLEPPSPRKRKSKISQASEEVVDDA